MMTHKTFGIQICQAVLTVLVAGLILGKFATAVSPTYTPPYAKLAEIAVTTYNHTNIGAVNELVDTGRNFK